VGLRVMSGNVIAIWYSWSRDILDSTTHSFELDALSSKELDVTTGMGDIVPGNSTTDSSVLILRIVATVRVGEKSYANESLGSRIN